MAISKLPDLSPPTLRRQALFSAIADQLGSPTTHTLDDALPAILEALGARVPLADARAVAYRLPGSLGAAILHRGDCLLAPTAAAFEDHLHQRGIDARVGRAAVRVLAERLGEQGRAHLRLQPLRSFLDA